ncbi:hypothetical protein [Pseudonocardia sp. DLS-67]
MIQQHTAPPPWAPVPAPRHPAPPAFGPAPAGLRPGPPVQIRPRLLWVGLAWLLFALLVLAGVATYVTGTTGAGGPERFFAGGEATTLELDPAADPVIYAALDAGGYVRCTPVGAAATNLQLTLVTDDRSVPAAGREWHAAFELVPAAAGTYQVVCEGPDASFAFGEETPATVSAGGATLALLVLPLTGLVAALTTTISVLSRRRAAQDRLLAPWTGGTAW